MKRWSSGLLKYTIETKRRFVANSSNNKAEYAALDASRRRLSMREDVKDLRTEGPTDGSTDGPTDGRMDEQSLF